jgi:hypothetical protein
MLINRIYNIRGNFNRRGFDKRLSRYKEEVFLEIPILDALADMEVCLCKYFPLLMILSGSRTGAASGLSWFSLV